MRGKKGNKNSDGLSNLSWMSIYEPFLWGPKTNSTCIIFFPQLMKVTVQPVGTKSLALKITHHLINEPIYHLLLHFPLPHLSLSSHWCRPITTIFCHLLSLTPTQCAGPPLFFWVPTLLIHNPKKLSTWITVYESLRTFLIIE